MECVTAGSVNVKAVGRGSIVTAVPALKRACQRMALCAAAGGNVSAAGVSALYREHLGASVRSAQPVEMPVTLQGENMFMPPALRGENRLNVEVSVGLFPLIDVSLPERYKMLSPYATRSACSFQVRHIRFWSPCSHVSTPLM